MRGYCTNNNIMCQSASIVSRMLCRGCRHVSRKALQSPTTRSVTTTNKKARGTAKGMSKHNSKACPKPGRHVPKPSKIKVRVDLGRQKIVPETSRQGTGRPRAPTKDPRAAQEAAKAAREPPTTGEKPAKGRPKCAREGPRLLQNRARRAPRHSWSTI